MSTSSGSNRSGSNRSGNVVAASSLSVYQVPATAATSSASMAARTQSSYRGGSNSGSAAPVVASSFSVFQVPAATAVIPSARPNNSYASTISSSGSFDDGTLQQQQMTVPLVFGGSGSGLSATAPASAAGPGVADVFIPLDDSYYTHSSRSHRGSVSTNNNNRFGAPGGVTGGIPLNYNFSSMDSEARGGIGWMRTGRVIRVKETGESFRFPLEDDHLPRVTLTGEQYTVLKKRAVQMAEQAIGSNHLWMENPTLSPQLKKQKWKAEVEKKNCTIYRQRGTDTKNAQSRNALVRAKLDCTLDELAYALNCDNTDDQRILMAHIYQDSFLDGAVLHVAETASFEDPFQFLGVKWMAFQSSVDSVYAVRDVLVVDMCKTFKDSKGQKILARISQSINIKEYKGDECNFGFARNQVSWVHLFRSMGPGSGRVDASLSTNTQFSGKATPSWLANRMVTSLYNVVMNLSTAADAKYIVKSRLITDKKWVPNNERPACSVCFKSFNLLRSRHHCRVCAEIMCTSCTMELTILSIKLPPGMQPETGTNLITSSEKFCLKCVNKCRQDRRNALLAVMENQSAFSAAEEAYEVSNYDRHSEVYLDERASLSEANARPFTTGSTSSFASNSSGGSGAAEKGNAINYYGWSSKVLTAMGSKPGDIEEDLRVANASGSSHQAEGLRVRSNHSGSAFDRHRQGSDASVSSGYSDNSNNSFGDARWDRHDKENYGHANANANTNANTNAMILLEDPNEVARKNPMILLEEAEDVVNVNPIPTSFVKMEESIAAQQAILRSMIIEGQKMMMNSNTHAQYRPPPPPQNEFITLEDHQPRLALPPSTTITE